MKISEYFDSSAASVRITSIEITDSDGKSSTVEAMSDIIPDLLKMPEEWQFYHIISGSMKGSMKFNTGINEFMGSLLIPFKKYIQEYVNTAQEVLITGIGMDVAAFRESHLDGFEIASDNELLSPELLNTIAGKLNEVYPGGPLTQEVVDSVLKLADEHLQVLWDSEANEQEDSRNKMFIGFMVLNSLSNYATRASKVMFDNVVAPLRGLIQRKMDLEADNKRNMPVTDLFGIPLRSDTAESRKKQDIN